MTNEIRINTVLELDALNVQRLRVEHAEGVIECDLMGVKLNGDFEVALTGSTDYLTFNLFACNVFAIERTR